MRKGLSIAVLVLSVLSVGAFSFVAITQLPYAVIQDSEGWGSMIFKIMIAPALAGGTFLFAVVPSAVLFWKFGRHTRDRMSLWISTMTLGAIVLTWVLIEPLRHAVIFGK